MSLHLIIKFIKNIIKQVQIIYCKDKYKYYKMNTIYKFICVSRILIDILIIKNCST